MQQASRHQLPLALLFLLVGALQGCSPASAQQTIATQGFKESSSVGGRAEELASALNRAAGPGNSQQLRANSPLLAVPLSLARFMFPKPLGRGRADGDPSALMMGASNKRSAQASVASGGLDTLIGASGLGKRSVPSEYINIEPVFAARPVAVWRGLAPQARSRNLMPSAASWEPASSALETLEIGNEA